jgi:hypothetical protein
MPETVYPPVVDSMGGFSADTRLTDPTESHAARDSISTVALAESQAEVLAILHLYGPQPDHEIVTLHELRAAMGHTLFTLSGSRLRTARHELEQLGKIMESGSAVTSTGRRTRVWKVTE